MASASARVARVWRISSRRIAHQIGEAPQHQFLFPLFPVMQQVEGVVVLHDGQRLQKQGGLGLGLVVDDAGDRPPVVGLDGDDVAAVALGDEWRFAGPPGIPARNKICLIWRLTRSRVSVSSRRTPASPGLAWSRMK